MSISYELPMSIEFNNGTANGSQMMVAKRGPLNQGQLIVLQATVSNLKGCKYFSFIFMR